MTISAAVVAVSLAALVIGVASFAYARSQLVRMRFEIVPTWDDELPNGAAEVLAALSSAVIVLDTADRVVKATPAAFALGLVREGRTEQSLLQIAHTVRSTGLIDDREIEFYPEQAASPLSLVLRVVPLGALHVLILVEDRTEARRAEDVRRDFVANVSHELKTPIGAISLLAESMGAAADDPATVTRFAGRLEADAARLNRLVQEIIDLSKLQSSVRLDDQELVEIDDVIAEAIDRCRLAAEARDIVIRTRGRRGAKVFGDTSLLTTAVGNLIANAVHYSEPDTRIAVGVRKVGDYLEVSVDDQGLGLSPEDQDRVFERFYRVDKARSRATGGTGLGLSIVKHVAAVHGGEVKLESQLGIGSTFTLRLPIAPDVEQPELDSPVEVKAPHDETRPAGLPTPRPAALRAARPTRKASA